MNDLARAVAAAVDRARAAGRDALLEHEGLALVAAAGFGVPRHVLVRSGEPVPDLAQFPGDRVVVKAVAARLPHKSDAGGVRVVPRDAGAVTSAVRAMEARFAGAGLEGVLVEEFVPHDADLGGELLLGLRWTEDFGPVVTLGPGGVHGEFLATNLAPGRGVAIVSPALRDAATIDRALAGAAIARFVTTSQRGAPPQVTRAELRRAVERFLDLADAAPPGVLAEFEVNPLVFTDRGPVALDALGRLGAAAAAPESPRPLEKIACLLAPRSIAVAGVSERTNPGRIIAENVLRDGFPAADLVIVKPGVPSMRVEGAPVRCVPDVRSLPGTVDLLVLAVDAAQSVAAGEEAARLGKAESVLLIPGGIGEREGSEGHVASLRRALAASRATPSRGPVVNGANCLGVRSAPGRFNTLFIPEHKLRFAGGRPAPLAVLSQSGAFAVSWASEMPGLDPRYVVTFGNQVDLTAGDWLEAMAARDDVRVVACYVEGFRPGDGRHWLDAARRIAASGRTVILYRAGRTPAGAAATASHTASVAGDHAVCRALAESAGVVVADGLDEFTDLTRLFCLLDGRDVGGLRLGALSNAGFECVAIADHAGPFTFPAFSETTRARLGQILDEARLGAIVGVRNPFDVTPILGDAGFEAAAAAMLDDPEVDAGLVGCVPLSGALATLAAGAGHGEDVLRSDSVVQRLARLWSATRKPWVVVVDAGPLYDPMARALDAAGVPTFRAADRALAAFGRWCTQRLSTRRHPSAGPTR